VKKADRRQLSDRPSTFQGKRKKRSVDLFFQNHLSDLDEIDRKELFGRKMEPVIVEEYGAADL